MDLFEYQGKQYFARYGIPVSPGDVAYTVDEAVAAAEAAGYPVVVKAQVQVGGRGKAGGIKLADSADEVRTHAGNILGMDIKGHLVKRVWVEHASDISKEYYASYSLDRAAKRWPDVPRSKLIVRVIISGGDFLASEVESERLSAAVARTQGRYTDAYGAHYLQEIRDDWSA